MRWPEFRFHAHPAVGKERQSTPKEQEVGRSELADIVVAQARDVIRSHVEQLDPFVLDAHQFPLVVEARMRTLLHVVESLSGRSETKARANMFSKFVNLQRAPLVEQRSTLERAPEVDHRAEHLVELVRRAALEPAADHRACDQVDDEPGVRGNGQRHSQVVCALLDPLASALVSGTLPAVQKDRREKVLSLSAETLKHDARHISPPVVGRRRNSHSTVGICLGRARLRGSPYRSKNIASISARCATGKPNEMPTRTPSRRLKTGLMRMSPMVT